MPISRCAPPRSTCACSSSRPASTSWCARPSESMTLSTAGRLNSRSCASDPRCVRHSSPDCMRLAAGVHAARDVAQAPEREQLVEGIVRVGFRRVLRLTTCRDRAPAGCGRRLRSGWPPRPARRGGRLRQQARQQRALRSPRPRRATAAPAAHGSQRGWMLLPNTSPAARRTTLALTRWRSSVNAPSNARSLMMLMRRGTPPDRRWISRKRAVREHLARGAGDAQAMAHVCRASSPDSGSRW